MNYTLMDLEKELQDQNRDLSDKLNDIKSLSGEAWKTVKLYWYTDHGPGHSKNIIGIIGEILKPLYTKENHPGQLNEDELFILLASCHLHDLGMQDINIPGINVEKLTLKQYKDIRKRHPSWSAQYIRNKLLGKLGHYKELVAIISEAHGTEYFEKGIKDNTLKDYHWGGKTIRGRLLAALLLMGDELDLQQARIDSYLVHHKDQTIIYPPESLLHIFKHHYISEVRIVDAPGKPYECNIEISWQFPEDSTEYADDLKRWVYYKLRRQREVTRDSLAAVGLTWGEIRFRDGGPTDCLPFPEAARPHLQKETLERRLINREELLRRIKDYLELTPPGNEVLMIGGEDGSDQEAIWDWLKVYVDCLPNLRLLPLDFNIDSSPRMDYINSETEALLDPHTAGILVISNLQNLEPGVRDWLLTQRLPQMVAPEKRNVAIAMSLGEPPEVSGEALQACPFSLHRFSVQQVADHLVTKLGYPRNDASVWALHFKPADFPAGDIISEVELLQSNLEIQGQLTWKH